MRKLLFICSLFCFVAATAQPDTTQKIIAGRTNSPEQQQKPYVILISLDGFRYDYAEKYDAVNIKALSATGVKAESMIPSYPSLTFPNHYTLVTGLYPSHHGLVSNGFYAPDRREGYSMKDSKAVKDGSWYGGTPLWVLAEEQHMLSASFYWVGSEAAIKGTLPTYYYNYNEAIPNTRRVEIVKDWLLLPPEKRPHLITVYFPETDHAGHKYGPDAPETGVAVKVVDSAIGQLADAVRSTGLPVSFIIVSDHGMAKIDVQHQMPLPAVVDTSHFIIPRGSELVMLYAKKKKYIKPTYRKLKAAEKDYTVYLKKNMPANLHYSKKDDRKNHIGDILLLPTWPATFYIKKPDTDIGSHGFNPYTLKQMDASFFAWGPAFRTDLTIPSFQNVDVYPIVTTILGLHDDEAIDGTMKVANEILK
ncbi:MAG: ectonucleotide pyrophosphatase/phosphodiesterase [Ferruginibacter sp.]